MRRCWLAVGILLTHAVAQGADPSVEVKRLIQERRAFMADIGATLRMAWEKFDRGDPLDREARRIRDAALRMTGFFPPGSFGKGSRARPSISERHAEFRRLARELEKTAEALVEQAKTRDQRVIRVQLLQVGAACRACHTRFVEHPR